MSIFRTVKSCYVFGSKFQHFNIFKSLQKSHVACQHTAAQSKLFNTEHDQLKTTLSKIIEKDINPYVDEWEKKGIFNAHEVFKKLAEAGLLGITRETEYGGLGLDYSFSVAFFEELSKINCGGVPMGILVHTDCSTPALSMFGSDRLKRQFLAPSISGDLVSCIGVSEPECGSDVASIRTTAKVVGGDFVINGAKMWITNGCQADWMCLLANTSEGLPHRNKSLICVPLDLPGVHISKISKLGMHSSDTAQISFEDVKVPLDFLIGEKDRGFTYQMIQFQEERLSGIALSIEQMSRIIAETIEYCKQRSTFGQPIIKNQVIFFRFAELQTEVEALRSLLYRAVASKLEGNDVTMLASMGKLKAGRLCREVIDSCLQYWGGMGYTNEVLVSRFFRDSRLLSIGAGTDEMMLSIISKYMGILPKPTKN